MSSLLSTLSIAQSGLSAVSSQLQVTSSNVSNAGTAGYTRKSTLLASATLGDVGGGVNVIGFTRNADSVLFTSLSKATSNASFRETQNDYMQRVMDLLGLSSSDDPPLSSNITAFVKAWTALETEPESSVAQQQVINAGMNLSEEVRRVSSGVEDLDRQNFKELGSTLTDLNNYLSEISDLNAKISSAQTGGMASGDLEDDRDQLLLKISKMLNITTLSRGNGQIAIYTNSGYQLLDGSSISSFSYDGTSVVSDSNPTFSLNGTLTGGSIEALVNFRDSSAAAAASTDQATGVLQKLRDQLDLIADAFLTTTTTATSGEDTFAAAYNSGAAQAGELASGFFTGADRTDFAVNSALTGGTAKIKFASIGAVVDSLLDSTRAFSASGLTTTGASYASLATASLTDFQQAANTLSTLGTTASDMVSYLNEKYSNKTGVNVDEEMIALIILQNVYTANARVLSVVQDLFKTLQTIV